MRTIALLALILFSLSLTAQVGIGTTSPSEELDIESTDATNTSIDINNTGGGDPLIHFQVAGTSTFSIGIDNSDSDKLKIGTSALETNTRLTIDASGNVGIGDDSPVNLLEVDGSARFNRSGAAVDFQIEGDAVPYLFFADGSADMVGIGTSSPNATLDVNGSATFNKGNGDNDFKIEGQTDGSMFYVDASTDMVGISTSSPSSTLEIAGSLTLKTNTITGATTLDNTHNIVFCNSGAYTVTLPTAASVAGKTYYIKNINTNGDDINIDGTGSESIDGDLSLVLYVYNDAVRVVSDGSNWRIVADERQAHRCQLYRNTAQSISNATDTKVSLDTKVSDVGDIGDVVTGNRIEVVRTGDYLITASWTCQGLEDQEAVVVWVEVNGTQVVRHYGAISTSTTNQWSTVSVSELVYLTSGQYVEMYIRHGEGAAQSTLTADHTRPTLTVTEIR